MSLSNKTSKNARLYFNLISKIQFCLQDMIQEKIWFPALN